MEQLVWEASYKSDWTELILIDKVCTEPVQVVQGRKEDSKSVTSGKLMWVENPVLFLSPQAQCIQDSPTAFAPSWASLNI